MDKLMTVINNGFLSNKLVEEIMACNEKTAEYGLKLSKADVQTLMTTRKESLKANGRVEFSGDIIIKLVENFCDSPYISQYNYLDTIDELIDTFYYYKNETLDFVGDDELIEKMKEFFNGSCEGSVELLQNRELYKVEYNIKHGVHDFWKIKDDLEVVEDEEDY